MVLLRPSWTRLPTPRSLQKRCRWSCQFQNGRRLRTTGSTPLCQIYPTGSSMFQVTAHNKRGLSNYPPIRHDLEEEALSIGQEALQDGVYDRDAISMIDREVDQDIDGHLTHLRTKLYPITEDGPIAKLYDAASVQEVFDIVSSLSGISTHDPIVASQALVTLWDLQKLLFQLGPIFNPNEDIANKTLFVQNIKESQVFQEKILSPVLEMHQQLQDESLCASLLALNKMHYGLFVTEPLIGECMKRKGSLSLPALSRLSVVLRSHNLYGQCALAEFSPLILKYVQSMTDDIEVRLVSILLRNSSKVVSETIFKNYVSRLSDILNSETSHNFETVTLCKIFLVLLDWGKSPQSLIHNVGYRLQARAHEMELIEVLSLQKFCLGPLQEPWSLVESLISRASRVIEECHERPRIDLISVVGSLMRGSQQKQKLAVITQECMENNDFATVQNMLFPLIKSIRVDNRQIYDKYWNNAVHLIENLNPREYRKTVHLAKNYLNFCHSQMLAYRNSWLESICKKQLYSTLDLYLSDPPKIIMHLSDFAVTLAFLLAFDQLYMDLKYVSKFEQIVSNIKGPDLCFIAKGIDCALIKLNPESRGGRKSYEIVSEVCSILEEECALRLVQSSQTDVNNVDLSTVWRLLSTVRRMKGDSPLLDVGITAFTSKSDYDSREIREATNALLSGSYFYPEAVKEISEYIFKNLEHVNPETVEKFVNLSYYIGWENDGVDFGRLADVIESNWERFGLGVIQCGISLGLQNQFRPKLIDKIFNVDFLDHIDEELRNGFGRNSKYPFKLRTSLMELNRIVCLDVPSSRLPWFHETFCQNVLSKGRSNPSFLHKEVGSVLGDIIGEDAVESNVCLPQDYYYNIDFTLKFDSLGRPIKTIPPRRLLSFARQPNPGGYVKRKVAILIFPNTAYTKNIRVLKGGYKMKERHLEILGYKVISIDPKKWNSMAMAEIAEKQKFLENEIFDLNK